MILPAFPLKPEFSCRFLLKMGLETVAQTTPEEVYLSRFDEARVFALTGRKGGKWWFLQREDLGLLSQLIRGENPPDEEPDLFGEVLEMEDEQSVFHVHFWYLDLFVPLTTRVEPDEGFREPEYRIFSV
jgi:hypothetical protein